MSADVEALEHWLSKRFGVDTSRGGVQSSMRDFVAQRTRSLRCEPKDYAALASSNGEELQRLANTVTVVYTWFFRDFGQLKGVEQLLVDWSEKRPMSVWVAGCATGEDAYSIALLAERLKTPVDILATDLNTQALSVGRGGEYHKRSLRNVDAGYREYFQPTSKDRCRLSERVRKRVKFEHHNLMDPPPRYPGGWDLVLCRNVLIYFSPENTQHVIRNLSGAVRYGGYVMLGAGEVIYESPAGMEARYLNSRLVLRRVGEGITLGEPRSGSTPHASFVTSTLPDMELLRELSSVHSKSESDTSELRSNSAAAVQDATLERASGVQELLALGHVLLEEGKLPQAVSEYTKAAEQEPTLAAPLLYRGLALYLSGSVEAAAKDLRAALFLDSTLWPAAVYLALSYESMGLLDDARREYRHVVRLGASASSTNHPLISMWQEDLLLLAKERAAMS